MNMSSYVNKSNVHPIYSNTSNGQNKDDGKTKTTTNNDDEIQQRMEDMLKDIMQPQPEEIERNDTTIEETAQASEDDNENESGNDLISIRDNLILQQKQQAAEIITSNALKSTISQMHNRLDARLTQSELHKEKSINHNMNKKSSAIMKEKQDKGQYKPIQDRLEEIKQHQEMMRIKTALTMPQRYEEPCSFKPVINKHKYNESGQVILKENTNSCMKNNQDQGSSKGENNNKYSTEIFNTFLAGVNDWSEKKQAKVYKMQAERAFAEKQIYTFHPVINHQKSQKSMGNKSNHEMDVVERLYEHMKVKQIRDTERLQDYLKTMSFTPKINTYSEEIVSKVDNGQYQRDNGISKQPLQRQRTVSNDTIFHQIHRNNENNNCDDMLSSSKSRSNSKIVLKQSIDIMRNSYNGCRQPVTEDINISNNNQNRVSQDSRVGRSSNNKMITTSYIANGSMNRNNNNNTSNLIQNEQTKIIPKHGLSLDISQVSQQNNRNTTFELRKSPINYQMTVNTQQSKDIQQQKDKQQISNNSFNNFDVKKRNNYNDNSITQTSSKGVQQYIMSLLPRQ